jgi:tetratricopeptide (TPR) repeat protein
LRQARQDGINEGVFAIATRIRVFPAKTRDKFSPARLARRAILGFLGVGGAVSALAAAPETGVDRLRALVKPPQLSANFSFGFNSDGGRAHFVLNVVGAEPNSEEVIAAARKKLSGGLEDAEIYARLSAVYDEAGDSVNSTASEKKAEELFRRRLEAQPKNGRLLIALADALLRANYRSGKLGEAETLARRAVEVAPNDAACWTGLATILQGEAERRFGAATLKKGGDLIAALLAAPPEDAQVKEGERLFDEASRCNDKAVALAPNEPQPRLERALHRATRLAVDAAMLGVRSPTRGALPQFAYLKGYFAPACVRDLRDAARLAGDDYMTLAGVAWFQACAEIIQSGGSLRFGRDLWNSLSEQTRRDAQELLARLEKLADDSDAHSAAGALDALAVARFSIRGDVASGGGGGYAAAIDTLRRSLGLDPSREETWEMAIDFNALQGKFEEALPLCEARLRRNDTPRARLLLAHVYDRLGKPEKAEPLLRSVLEEDMDHLWASAALAAILLKKSNDDGAVREAAALLVNLTSLISKTDGSVDREFRIHVILTSAIYYGLTGRVDDARRIAAAVVRQDSGNTEAREVLSALGG